MNMSNKVQKQEWNKIDWRKAEQLTFELQKRIYQASERGDKHCHDTKTAKDGSGNTCIHNKDEFTEERNEVKVSRSVLKES